MWPMSNLIYSIFIINSFATICSAITLPNTTTLIEESSLKMYLVEDIVRKICNISLDTFYNKNPAEKVILLVRIEEKLNESARALGVHGAKYVNLIMEGVRSKAYEKNQVANYNQAPENKREVDKKQSENDDIEVMNILRENTKSKSKGDLAQSIASKIELIAKGYLSTARTPKERQKILEHIKKTLIKTANRKHATFHTKQDDIKAYVDLIAKGIELVMERDSVRRRRMEFAYTNNINLKKDSQDRTIDLINPIKPNSLLNNELGRGASHSAVKSVFLRINEKSTLKPCDSSIEEACQKITLLKTLRCLSDNSEFNILKLCDGIGDCLDFSDENQCAEQAIQTIQTANRLIAYIETSINAHHCFPDLLDKSMLSKQNKVLSEVLKNQLAFLENHSVKKSETLSRRVYNTDKNVILGTVNEAVNVVDSLASALSMSICPNLDKNKEPKLDIKDLEKKIRASKKTDQENCKCNGQNCLQKCSKRCETVCFEMYSLTQLTCDAISGEELVSLDMVCDGKLDCYDELDEKDCSAEISLAKFEATHMYDYVLKEIEKKTASITLDINVRSRLQSLYTLVAKLQKLSLKRQPDILEVKRVRQSCFDELSKVYDSALNYMKSNVEELFNARFFLITLNERLISALKRSHTGNDKIISSDGCVCRGYKCALPRCSKSCIRACSVEPKLTRFSCGELSEQLNNSLPIELVCNGKVNCPNEEDENDCKKDVCRAHHIIVLRLKLQDVGKQYAGTALGEALKSWRLKVTATLMIAENNERPTPLVLNSILHDILHDLVTTYSVLEERRDGTPVFKEFYSWSRVVINTLKSCSH